MKAFIYNLDFVKEQSRKELFKVVSLFAGGGGSSTGYRLAGGKVLGVNEFIPAAQEVYKLNYPSTHIFKQDIRELSGLTILDKLGLKKGELDILDGSPPCSSFSTNGLKEKGWGKEKKYSDSSQITDDLFFEYARILKEVQPKVFIAENVKGITMGAAKSLLGSEQIDLFGEHENTIYHTLINAGYKVRYKVLNAKNYGVAQNRERTIFIGVRNDIDKKITFPTINKEIVTIGEALNNKVDKIVMKGNSFGEDKPREVGINDVCFTITADGLGASRRYYTVRSKSEEKKLSIDELKIICGFPSDYILTGSYSKQWERLGRSVPPLMMSAVSKHVYNTILKN